ncbi:transglycosylase domain-containing protein [Anaerophilus nitritogenes]|uniref:transglycosylase domain-containing protein n=1 Tax=Anaerophilus nitritogenes TaxID=2498136 RepID=UPI0013ECB346|nr:PBP1A family penicillin-binding protein [Anaerophilus nitritogenes]
MAENNEDKSRSSNKKKKKKKVSFLKVFFLMMILVTFIGAGILGGWVVAVINSSNSEDFSKIYTLLDENSFIYDSEGNLIEKVEGDGLRTIVKYNDIPDHLKNAFVSIEDKDFIDHNGLSFKRIVKAFIENVKAGAPVQGGSTITQQLVKNLYLSHDKKIERKIKEAYYAIQIERHLTKNEILEAYLNTIYLGGGAKGVQGAAYTYFSKDVSELSLAECALIAGITKNPTRFAPIKTLKKQDVDPSKHFIIDDSDEIYTLVYDDRYKPRQELVLKLMKEQNKITEEEYYTAINEDLKNHFKPGKKEMYDISSFFTDKVKNDVVQALMKELGKNEEEANNMLYNQGLRIYSTMDLRIQKILEKNYEENKNFPNLVARKDGAGNILSKNNKSILLYKHSNLVNTQEQFMIPKGDFKYDTQGNLVLLKSKRLNFVPLYVDGQRSAIQLVIKDSYIQNSGNEILVLKGGSFKIPSEYKEYDYEKNAIVSYKFLNENPEFSKKDSAGNLLIGKDYYSISQKGVIQPQSSMVIMDYRTGEIKALVGGREVTGKRLYNRALNPRQPGSSIKSIAIYAPAIDNGWTAADIVDDVPHYDTNGKIWPRNWYKGYYGLSSLREGLKLSMNVLPVKIGAQIGIHTSIDYLKKMGITTVKESGAHSDNNLAALALGGMTQGISPLEMTGAYGSLANEGVYIKPKSFIKITDRDGNIILENNGYKNRVISKEAAFIMTDMLKDVVSNGIAKSARLDSGNSQIPVAGKTGTTTDNYDAWFVGYTPYYVGATWIGNDINIELSKGSSASVKLWNTVMKQIHEGLPAKTFVKPNNIISLAVDTKSGKLPTELSRQAGHVRTEYFVKGTEPKEHDDTHVLLDVDTTTNKLASPYCPSAYVQSRIFVKRPVPYSPSKNGGIVPKDFGESAPVEYCTQHNEHGYTNDNSSDGGIYTKPDEEPNEQPNDEPSEDPFME